jgi:hypothetical protein
MKMGNMKINSMVVALIVVLMSGLLAASEKTTRNLPSPFDSDKELVLPANYQSWVAISPSTPGVPTQHAQHLVSKVYVEPAAYEGFVKHGAWPNHTVIVLELRDKETPARTPCDGVIGLEVAAKNSARTPDPWSYYGIIYDHHRHDAQEAAKRVCADCKDNDEPMDMRLAMYFPALRAVIHASPRTMQPSAF